MTETTATRKEIASWLRVSVNMVRRKEKEWGLSACRLRISKRPIEYHRVQAIDIIAKLSLPNVED